VEALVDTDRRWWFALALCTCVALAECRHAFAAEPDGTDPAALRQQLEETQRLLRELQTNFEKQNRAMKAQIESLERQLRDQGKVVESLQGGGPARPAAAARPRAEVTPPVPVAAPLPAPTPQPIVPAAVATPGAADEAREAWSPSAPIRLFGVGGAYLNISFDLLVDAGWSTEEDVSLIEPGDHDPKVRGFTIPNAEVIFEGAVDPYFKGFADVVWKLDQEGETSVEFEEGYLTTSSLPWNLQVKAGQQFVDFGRINLQHPHQWDFVDQPLVINRMFGPEGLRSVGAKLGWLTPTPFYSELVLSVLNSAGETAFSFRNTEDELFGRPPVDRPVSAPSDLLYVPRYSVSFDLTDSQTIVAGVSGAFGPNSSGSDTDTQIYGGDLYWKWKPAWQSAGFPFVAWQTEILGRRYEAGAAEIPGEDEDSPPVYLPRESIYDYGFYSQLTYGFRRGWVAGLRGEWLSGDHGDFPDDPGLSERYRISPDLTFYPSEFSKLRLQYNFDHGNQIGDQSSVWLQVEVLLGSHAAHKF
jgi:hypothetical protein